MNMKPCKKCLVKPICRQKCEIVEIWNAKRERMDKILTDALGYGSMLFIFLCAGISIADAFGWLR